MKFESPIICSRGLPAYGVQAGASASGGKSQIPLSGIPRGAESRSGTNLKRQNPNMEYLWKSGIGGWSLFGIWILSLGISPQLPDKIDFDNALLKVSFDKPTKTWSL